MSSKGKKASIPEIKIIEQGLFLVWYFVGIKTPVCIKVGEKSEKIKDIIFIGGIEDLADVSRNTGIGVPLIDFESMKNLQMLVFSVDLGDRLGFRLIGIESNKKLEKYVNSSVNFNNRHNLQYVSAISGFAGRG